MKSLQTFPQSPVDKMAELGKGGEREAKKYHHLKPRV